MSDFTVVACNVYFVAMLLHMTGVGFLRKAGITPNTKAIMQMMFSSAIMNENTENKQNKTEEKKESAEKKQLVQILLGDDRCRRNLSSSRLCCRFCDNQTAVQITHVIYP